MTCLPDSGGCERHRTDPFIHRYNQIHGTNYTHKQCLDRIDRNTPQPEALYGDEHGNEIVIERKTILWPPNYAAKHKNDHFIASLIAEQLRDIVATMPICLHMEPAGIMPHARLTEIAYEISEAIRASMDQLQHGQTIGATTLGVSWSCSIDPTEHEELGRPPIGLVTVWKSRDEMVDSENLPVELADQIRRIFESTVSKFKGYGSATGILVLEPHGSIRYTGRLWWADVFKTHPIPNEISEILHSTHDWITDTEQDWIFESLHEAH